MNPLLLTICCMVLADPLLKIEPTDGNDPRSVRVVSSPPPALLDGIAEGHVSASRGQRLLTFAIVDPKGQPSQPMLGRFQRDAELLFFVPRFPLRFGQSYRATLILSPQHRHTVDYDVPQRTTCPRPTVEAVYPGAAALPANNLKFYLHFSKPMREGRAIFDRIRLLDARGRQIPAPWRRTELWTEDGRRFTLWIHPGRIKQGVNLREEFGPVLQPGESCSLVITQQVQDADVQPLASAFVKEFRVTEPDYRRPLPQNWRLVVPAAGTNDPLTIRFGEPLDHALILRCIRVHLANGQFITVVVEPKDHETAADIRPARLWTSEKHMILVDDILEDLAGNTPDRVFDTSLDASPAEPPALTIPFTPATGAL